MKLWLQKKVAAWFERQLRAARPLLGVIIGEQIRSIREEDIDGRGVLAALQFVLEALERHPDPIIYTRATQHKICVMSARLHWYRMAVVNELPPADPVLAAAMHWGTYS